MEKSEILKKYNEVERLLAQQEPKQAIQIVEEVVKHISNELIWFKARGYFWLQLAYKQLLDINRAEYYGKKSLSIYRKLNDKVQAANVLRDTASLYDHIGKYDKALELVEKSLKEIGDQTVLQPLGLSLAKKGRILSEIGDYYGAEECLLAAEIVIDNTEHLMHRLTVSIHLMELYVKLKRFDKASYYADKSDKILKTLEKKDGYLNEIRYSQIQLSKSLIAQGKGKYKEAMMRFRNFLKFGIRPKNN